MLILMLTDAQKAAYLAAFIDGEGYIGLSLIKKTGYYTREIKFCNTDKILFDAVAQMCRDLGFPVSVYFYKRELPEHDIWHARLSGKRAVFERFAQMIPIQSERKKERLRLILDSYQDRDAVTLRRRRGEDTICAHCGKHFYAPPSERARFCSRLCHGLSNKYRVTKICETCGASFEVTRARAQARFCSLTCFGKSQSARMAEMGRRTITEARSAKYRKRSIRLCPK